ncbi:rhodanese-like domain-containing protein [Clostridium sp. UBA1056]|uniref:rhodanese-like domain-containing protein n=1 Tax=unclassified Clostridium TaxID=2614128 RepID=UPI003217E059
MKKKFTLILALCIIISTMLMGCSKPKDTSKEGEEKQYQYYTAEQLKTAIENKDDIYLLDIQVKEDYDKHHIVGTVPTYAYPADTEELTSKLDFTLDDINSSDKPVIVACPGGGGGAKKTIDYLTTKGVDASRMFILEKGQKGWPYDGLLEK